MRAGARSEPSIAHTHIEAAPVQALAALFDDGLPAPRRGEPLPALWHWVALPHWFAAAETGPDGHQLLGLELPDVGKPRRMFAGGQVELLADVLVDEDVRSEVVVLPPVVKSGRQGEFALVQVETAVFNSQDRLAIRERQDLVYLDAAATSHGSEPLRPEPLPVTPALLQREGSDWIFTTDPTKLLRFSAATSNSHRIHYDLPYARQVERYSGLVVHGPLMTLALAEILRLDPATPSSSRRFTHRALRPLFCGQQARVDITATDDEATELTLTTALGPHSSLRLDD